MKSFLTDDRPFALSAALVSAGAFATDQLVASQNACTSEAGESVAVAAAKPGAAPANATRHSTTHLSTTNYMGTTSAKGEGKGTSAGQRQISVIRGRQVQVGNARGIPPRGRPV